jgi:hypothetical protein
MTVSSTTSRADYTGNGSTTAFTVPFYFLDNSHVTVYSTVIATGATTTLVLGTDYTLTGAGVSTGGTVTTTVAPTTSQKLSILRSVPQTQLIHYVPNDPFPAATHEQALDQLTMEVQQVNETLARSIKLSSTNTMTSTEFTVTAANRANKVLGFDSTGELSVTQELGTYQSNWAASTSYKQRDIVKDASNSNIYICLTAHTSSGSTPISTNTDASKWGLIVDAAAAATSASSASASASAASTSASAASSSASAASTSASNASTSATNAATSASNASTSASSASTSSTNASNKYTLFHNQYQGSYSSDPTTRPDSSALQTGDLYFNTTVSGIKAYSGSSWVTAYNTGGGSALIASNNLSDLPNAGTARSNLGLGALATVTPGTGVATAAAAAVNATGGFITYTTYAPASGKTLTVSNSLTLAGVDGKTATFNNSLTFAGTDGTTMTFPATSSSIGYLNIPQNAQTSAYVAVVGDVGKHISITTGGVTVNASVFSAGDVFTIYNNSGSSQTITAGASVTFRLAGTATTGNRTLAQYGLATVLCVTGGATPTFVISGAGVT